MKTTLLSILILLSISAFTQCKKATIYASMMEFYKIDIKKNVLFLTYSQSGINSLMVSKGDVLTLELEQGEPIILTAKYTVRTRTILAGGLSRSEVNPTYLIDSKDIIKLSNFLIKSLTFDGLEQTIKSKGKKNKLMKLANCVIKNN